MSRHAGQGQGRAGGRQRKADHQPENEGAPRGVLGVAAEATRLYYLTSINFRVKKFFISPLLALAD